MGGLRTVGVTGAVVIATAAPAVAWFEGVIPYTYRDPVGIPTACAGETGPHIRMGQTFTIAECMDMMDASLWRHWMEMGRCSDAEVTWNQAAALLSWTYNVGVGNFCKSTLVKLLNSGAEPAIWCSQLSRWTKARKAGMLIELPGLVKRRAAERSMCLYGRWGVPALDAPLDEAGVQA